MKVRKLITILEAIDEDEFEVCYPNYDGMGDFIQNTTVDGIKIDSNKKMIILEDNIN